MEESLFPDRDEDRKIREETFHWNPIYGKPVPQTTHHISYGRTSDNIAIGYGARLKSDEEAIKAAIHIYETTRIKHWSNNISVWKVISGKAECVCDIQFK